MRVLRTIGLVAALTVTANAVAAQPIGLKFQSGPSSPQVMGYGYYVGPFSGTVLSNPTLPTINLFCVDVLNAISWGTKWMANVTSLALSDIGNTRHGTASLDNYRKAAWLTTQYSSTNKEQWAGIQAAVWNLLNPGKPNGGNAEKLLAQSGERFPDDIGLELVRLGSVLRAHSAGGGRQDRRWWNAGIHHHIAIRYA